MDGWMEWRVPSFFPKIHLSPSEGRKGDEFNGAESRPISTARFFSISESARRSLGEFFHLVSPRKPEIRGRSTGAISLSREREASLQDKSEKTRLFFQDRSRLEYRKRRYREISHLPDRRGGELHRSTEDQTCISIDRDDWYSHSGELNGGDVVGGAIVKGGLVVRKGGC